MARFVAWGVLAMLRAARDLHGPTFRLKKRRMCGALNTPKPTSPTRIQCADPGNDNRIFACSD